MSPGARVGCKALRRISPGEAQRDVLNYLNANGGNKTMRPGGFVAGAYRDCTAQPVAGAGALRRLCTLRRGLLAHEHPLRSFLDETLPARLSDAGSSR